MSLQVMELRRKRGAILEAARAILAEVEKDKRGLTDEERTKWDGYSEEAKRLGETIQRMETQNSFDAESEGTRSIPDLGDGPIRSGEDRGAVKPFRHFGEQLRAVAIAEQTQHRTVDKRLLYINDLAAREYRAATGLSEGVPADGGFLVQKDFASTLMQKTHETAVLQSRTQVIQIGAGSNGLKMNAIDESSRANGSRWGGIRVYRTNEAGTLTASDPKFRQVAMDLEKMTGLLYATDELLQDAVALGSVISRGFPEEFGFKMDDEIVNGDGAGKAMGLLNAAATVSVTKETGQAAATVVVQNIVKMWSRFWARARGDAVWLINQDVEPELFTMVLAVGTGGVPVYMPANGLSQSPFGTLMGRPVIPIEQCATLGTVGDIILTSLREYLWIEKGGIETASSIHVKFTTAETAFRFILRNNGQPAWHSALTPFKGTNTQSPYVTLATRS